MAHSLTVAAVSCLLSIHFFSAGALLTFSQDIIQSDSIIGGQSSAFVFRDSRKSKQRRYFSSSGFQARRNDGRFASSSAKLGDQAQSSYTASGRVRSKPIDPAAVSSLKTPTSNAAKLKASETYTGIGEQQLVDGNYDRAVEAFETAISFNPQNTAAVLALSETLTKKGRMLFGMGETDAAALSFRTASEKDPKNAGAYAGLGLVSEQVANLTDAVWNYERALALDSSLTEIYSRLGSVYLRLGEIAKADETLRKAALADPDDVGVQLDLAYLELKRRSDGVALERLRRVASKESGSAEAHYMLGAALAEAGKDGDANSEYQKALAIDPDYVPALYDVGVAKYNDGKYAEATRSYEAIASREPDNGIVRANLADSYRQTGELEKADENYRAAAENIKGDSDLYTNWGYTLGMLDRWDESVEVLTSATEARPDAVTNSNLGWAYYNAAQSDADAGRSDEAEKKWSLGRKVLQTAVEMDGSLAAAFLNFGSTLNRLGSFQEAAASLLRATDLKRDWLPALNELGISYRKLGKLADAVASFQKVVDINERFKGGLFNLGEAQLAAGNKKDAEKTLKRLRAIDPDAAGRLEGLIQGKIKEKIDQVNPLKKIPRLPF